MRPAIARKLAEVEASYRTTVPAAHRCGLQTCQEDGECAFPTRCVALPSDLSPDNGYIGPVGVIGEPADPDAVPRERHYDSHGRVMSLPEVNWRNEGRENGWSPPDRRPRWKRLPVIRHIAALRMSWQVHTYAGAWADVGIGLGGPHPHDLWVVEGAYHGYW